MAIGMPEAVLQQRPFSPEDVNRIFQCRGKSNRLGFAYQLAFVRFFNRFPNQDSLEIDDEILEFASAHTNIGGDHFEGYGDRRKTVSEHQKVIRRYLGLHPFHQMSAKAELFLLKEASHLEQTAALKTRLSEFLRQHHILEPASHTVNRLIQKQREAARNSIYQGLAERLSEEVCHRLDLLLETNDNTYSPLHYLKQAPGNASPASFLKLTEILERIEKTGILAIDMAWINNNLQRSFARYARQSTLYRLKRLKVDRRHTVLACFLSQLYRDTFDATLQMHDKLMSKVYNKADKDIDAFMKARRRSVRASLKRYQEILGVLLDENIAQEGLYQAVFTLVDIDTLKAEKESIDGLLGNDYSDSFQRVVARHSYLRQFAPALIKHVSFQADPQDKKANDILKAVTVLKQMNEAGKRQLSEDAPMAFIPKKLEAFVFQDGKPHKPSWECALLTALRDQVKSGNLYVSSSKSFASLDTFFIPDAQWASMRENFFARAGLPISPDEVSAYLTERLNQAYDRFLERLPENQYAQLDKDGWRISSDPTEKLDDGTDEILNPLKNWLGEHIRTIKLPALLIEVDNGLRFSRCFMSAASQRSFSAQHVCEVLATVLAHASATGPYTMAQLTDGISYHRMKHITDWYMHEENHRSALALVVNAISELDISQYWGDGTTSSSDGQRFPLHRKVLYKSFSHAFNDFALEFYNFVADNFAPYFSLPHDCAERDAAFVLDGLLYNESDLNIQEHYTDTHGFTDTNFAAFAMYGKRFSPRIKGLHKQAIFYLDASKDYGPLSVLLENKNRLLKTNWIVEQWDRMGHFYASLESGYATASTALRRLNGFSGKNHFFQANRQLGRLMRTEYTLDYLSDPAMRRRTRRGLLKGEQIHALARDIRYGHQGKLTGRDWLKQKHACSSLTLVIACIIYWQAKEIHRIIQNHNLPKHIELDLLSHISPVSWDNIILYGDYILNRNKVILP